MQFETQIRLSPNLFYGLNLGNKPHFFFPIHQLEASDSLIAAPYSMAENVYTNFSVKAVGHGVAPESSTDIIGFLFKSNLPVANYRTSILSYARSWQQSADSVVIKPDELVLSLKDEHFLMYHAPGKATLITSISLNDSLHDYLTMI